MNKIIMLCIMVITAVSCIDAPLPSPPSSSSPTEQSLQTSRPRPSADLPARLTQNQEDRSIWQRPDIVLSTLGDLRDKTIADLGAGTGYFTWRLIPHTKKVIALDIDDEAIAYLDSMSTFLPDRFKSHLEVRKTNPEHAELVKDEADIVLIVNTYTYLPDRINYLKDLHSLLPEDGQVLIIDFKKKNIPIGPDAKNRVALYQIENELNQAGFHNIISDDQSLNYQYIVKAGK